MTYVYDANGNIVFKTPYTNVTSSDLSTATQGTAIVYGYGDGNWKDKLTAYGGTSCSCYNCCDWDRICINTII